MPYGGNDWLALTQEPTLEPEIAICDPHHHFWDFRSARIPYQRVGIVTLTSRACLLPPCPPISGQDNRHALRFQIPSHPPPTLRAYHDGLS